MRCQHRGINFDQYLLDFGNANTVIHHHECELCGMGIIHTARNIENHLMTQHGVSMAQYYEEFKHSIKIVNLEITDESLFQVDAASIMLEKQWRLPSQLLAEGLPMRSPSVDWADRCLYECKVCRPSRKFNSKNKISFHVKRMHGLKMTEYNQKYGSSLLSRSWHTCQICGISILCDYFSLYQHITKGHKVTLNDYQEQLMSGFETEKIEWLNRCIFGCKICKQEFQFRSDFINHIEAV